jgi:hypothetical protein
LDQLATGVLPSVLDSPDSEQSTSTRPPPETDDEIVHDGATDGASLSRLENGPSASAGPSSVAQTSPERDSTDGVSASESEDCLESPVPRGLSVLKRRPSGPLSPPSGSDDDRGPKNARLAELGEGAGDLSDVHEHLSAEASPVVSDTDTGSEGDPDPSRAAGASLPPMRPGFENISDGTFHNQVYLPIFSRPLDHNH